MTADDTADDKDRPGVIAPPPLVFFAFLGLGLGLDGVWPLGAVPGAVGRPAGFALIAIGVGIFAAAIYHLRQAGTSVQTRMPATAVVTSGPFRFSRNPIYLSASLAFAGIGLAADNVWILALVVPFLAVIRYGVISREERYLEAKFGEEYRRYKASVRRWL